MTSKLEFVVVNTVNTKLDQEYDFGIHRFGCADVKRAERAGCQVYRHTARNVQTVVDDERMELAADFGEESADMFTFRVFPCCEA